SAGRRRRRRPSGDGARRRSRASARRRPGSASRGRPRGARSRPSARAGPRCGRSRRSAGSRGGCLQSAGPARGRRRALRSPRGACRCPCASWAANGTPPGSVAVVAGWTRFVLRHRRALLGAWIVVFLAGGFASSKLSPLLSNTFNVPGTDSERVRAALEEHFGDRPDGSFTIVFQLSGPRTPSKLASLQRLADQAAPVAPRRKPTTLPPAGPNVASDQSV